MTLDVPSTAAGRSKPHRPREPLRRMEEGRASQRPRAKKATDRAPVDHGQPKVGGPMHEMIIAALVSEILSGTLLPGMAIDERSISSRFGVSRTPVRHAIARLRAQGLVHVRPRSGSFVARIPLSEVLQLFEFMAELEAVCAKYSAERMDQSQRTELRTLAEACREASAESQEAYSRANIAFHDVLYRGSGNAQFESSARSARMRVSAYRRYTLELPGRLAKSVAEHFQIIDAIEQHDGDGAYRSMRNHMDIQREDYAPFILNFERNDQNR